jgi:hypothetical protein
LSYHITILRTQGKQQIPIRQEEVVSIVGGQFGFRVERNQSGAITQLSKDISGTQALLFYDHGELWAKTPGEALLRTMIEIAGGLGSGARVRGDEAETYRSVTETFRHPDDAQVVEETPKIHWPYILSRLVPILGGLILVIGFGALLVRYLTKS